MISYVDLAVHLKGEWVLWGLGKCNGGFWGVGFGLILFKLFDNFFYQSYLIKKVYYKKKVIFL